MYPGELKNINSCKNVNTNIYSSITHNGKKVKIDKYIYMYIYFIYTTIYVSAKKATNTLWNMEKSGNHYTK